MVSASIIVPVYNPGNRLVPCLESIIAQKRTDWELILVDDASTDGSGAICDVYAQKDDRIRVIHTPNQGPGASRNTGIQAASAPRIAFIDSDDTVDPDYLEILLDGDAGPGGITLTGIEVDYEDKRFKNYAQCEIPARVEARNITEIPANIPILLFGHPVSKLFDTELLRSIGFPTDIRKAEDHTLFLQYLRKAKKIVLMPGLPYHYWHAIGSNSLIHSHYKTEFLIGVADIITEELFAILEENPSYSLRAFRKTMGIIGLRNYLDALRNAESDEEYKMAADVIKKKKALFFKYFRPRRGALHKWWDGTVAMMSR